MVGPSSAPPTQSRRAPVPRPRHPRPRPARKLHPCRRPSPSGVRSRIAKPAGLSSGRTSGSPPQLQQAADRIEPELREAGETRRQERGEAAHGGEHPKTHGGPPSPLPAAGSDPARIPRGLNKEVDRVIDRFADQGDADPKVMPCTTPKLSATAAMPTTAPVATGKSPKPSAGTSDTRGAGGTINENAARNRQPHGRTLDFGARATANATGPLKRNSHAPRIRRLATAVSKPPVRRQSPAPGHRCRNRQPRFAQQQCALAVAGDPHTVLRLSVPGVRQSIDDVQHLARRIVGHQRLDDKTLRRREIGNRVAHGRLRAPRRGNAAHRPPRSTDTGARTGTRDRFPPRPLAVIDARELGVLAQALHHLDRDRRAREPRPSLDGNENQARGGSVADDHQQR